jgi:hypothetical protein
MNFKDDEIDKILYFLELVVSLSALLHDPLIFKILQSRAPQTEDEWYCTRNGAHYFEYLIKNGPFRNAFDADGTTYYCGVGKQFASELAKRTRSKTANSLKVIMPLILAKQDIDMQADDKELECINKRISEENEYAEKGEVYIKAFKEERARRGALYCFFWEMHHALKELFLSYKDFNDFTIYFRNDPVAHVYSMSRKEQ